MPLGSDRSIHLTWAIEVNLRKPFGVNNPNLTLDEMNLAQRTVTSCNCRFDFCRDFWLDRDVFLMVR